MEVKGTIEKIFETQTVGNSGFRKREVILRTEEQYPQYLKIEFVQDKTSLLDNFKPGDEVSISINLRGRKWVNPEGETIYFNSIQGWRIMKSEPAFGEDVPPPLPEDFPSADDISTPEDDDLPF